MSRLNYGKHYLRRRRQRRLQRAAIVAACIAGIGICVTGAVFLGKHLKNNGGTGANAPVVIGQESSENTQGESGDASAGASDAATAAAEILSPAAALLAQAKALATGYDYDGAIALLSSDSQYASDPEVVAAMADYEAIKGSLVRANVGKITHVFFHSLVVDNKKAFDGDSDEAGYNQVMTTIGEFEQMLQVLYDKGYVLVRLHDMAYEGTDENGSPAMKAGDILLPEGKTPFVMSQDDLCYYPYMTGDGFASRMVIGEDGKPTCEMKMDDGSISTGAYDLVPILENFIQEHPDFSYKGARAVLAFTGYEGILGYRTAASYADSETYEQDRQDAAKVAQCLRDNGWELASHSWGHLNLGTVEWDRFKADTDKWENEVESLIGPTDIILYPFGADIGDWHPYTTENPRYEYLHQMGFRYFCNVDSNPYWVQIGDDFMRQGRRNLDGYRMWKDITAEDPSHRKLDDLFRAEDIFDPDRPTPVPDM
ncbi:MAG: polysaccharide deacetylase [Lachnospiraceae bacterium]|nr:polysaccharide deacetylase [Lachnospiraceae bacterium]